MGSQSDKPPVVFVVGETASGKTTLAIEIACRFNGEVIAADARTIYKGMDIGTAKPTSKERAQVRHHLLDIVSPGQNYTVADFKRDAEAAIRDIADRGKLPIVAGGNGLYVDALLYDFAFRGKPDYQERERLQKLSVPELQRLIEERGLPMPTNPKNPRHLVGVLETGSMIKGQNKPRENTLVLAVAVSRDEIISRIHERTLGMIKDGLEEEVRHLSAIYGWEADALNRSIGYTEFKPYLNGECSIDEVVHAIEVHTRQLAKRQRTWFRRNKSIHYIRNTDEAVDLTTTFLNKEPIAN